MMCAPTTVRRGALQLAALGAIAASATAASAHGACAQVMEIGEGGQIKVYDRPYTFDATGAKPVVERAAPLRRRPAAVAVMAPGKMLQDAADSAALSPELIAAVAWRESRFRPGVVSRAGAVGEMQLMPGTARALGVDPRDSAQNYRGGAAYLGGLMRRYDGDLIRALAAYNAGPGAVDRNRGTPPYKETRAYVAAILDRLSEQAVASGPAVGR